ncbi:MAG: FAD:protein FMN transferase [Firmicutes bacterium]|nr:FAD:protein FMN transferase [Bacillota bacterium]
MRQSTVNEGNSFGMNTEIAYSVFGEKAESAIAAMTTELLRLENKLSRFMPSSEVSRINRLAGLDSIKISRELYEILSFAHLVSEISQGMFDITVAPLVDLWGYKKAKDVPAKSKIRNILLKVDYRELILNPKDHIAGLSKLGHAIDLGGIGKGYASDRCMQLFQQYGVNSAYINIGGNVATLGNKPDSSLWRVGIRHPRHDQQLIGVVRVAGKAVVTSGDYERCFFDRQDKRWHHILDPTTGYPAESGLISVSVIADSAMIADALSTAIFVAGLNKGIGYLAQFPRTEIVIVDKNLQVFITPGLNEWFHAADGIKVNII